MIEKRKGKSEDRDSQATPERAATLPAQGASDQGDAMDTVVGRYEKRVKKEGIRKRLSSPGMPRKDMTILEAMEVAMRYDDDVMKTRCNR